MITPDAAFLDWRARPSRDALRTLLLACQDRVYSLSFQVLRQEQDAEDAAQTSLVEISRALPRIENPGAFRSWMYRVALNNALSLRRERVRREEREKRRAAMIPTAHADLRDAVHDALAELEDDERALVVEHYFEKATLDDLGARRGISGVAIWKRIDHAKEKMRKSLAGAGLTVGLTQMTSVLEAAEFTPAPPGVTFEAALGRPGSRPPAKFVFGLGMLMGVVAVIAFLAVAGPLIRPVILDRYVVRVSPPLPEVQAPDATPQPPAPVQDESTRVLDPDGKPVQGALVFPGRWFRLRGDDAFDLFRPHSIKDGVATDAEGKFQLETKAPFITAWHDEYSPTTVSATEKVIRLKARGALKGRLIDAAGKPRAGVAISLDKRGPKVTTDEDGRFHFEKVIAGYRGLILPNFRLGIAVRIDPGETVEVDIGPGVDVNLDVSADPLGPGRDVNSAILGVGRTFSVVPVRGKTPTLAVKGVLPGRYFYGERGGALGWVDITEKGGKVEFGTSTMVVEADTPVQFYVLPKDANEIIEVAVIKMGLLRAPHRIEYLTEGEYEIRNVEGVTLQTVKVGPGETKIKLR